MKLSRKQELALIDLGLKQVLEILNAKPKAISPTPTRKWSASRRKKFMKTVAKKKAVASKMTEKWGK